MRIETRNLLAEFILSALDNPIAADALRCLAHYCRSDNTVPTPVAVAVFLAPISITTQQQAAAILRHNGLVQWQNLDGSEHISLAPTVATEYREVAARLARYATAIDAWYLPGKAPGTVSAREAALQKGALLFNHHLFFEVHEILEEQWKEESGDVRLFLQGLIQIAVAFHHLGNNNFRGATALLHDGLAKITPHQPEFLDIELQTFIVRLGVCQQELQRLGPEHFQQFPLELILSIKFVR